jgi:hypothetical protein
MECDTNILHAAYLKHAYVHAQAHSVCESQCSAILLGSMSGIVLAAENICASSWYHATPIQTLIYRACQRGLSCYGMDIYSPMAPTDADAIAIRESGIRSVTFHKEYMDLFDDQWETYRSLPFLEVNNVIVRCWTGHVTKKNLSVNIRGRSFQP